MPVARAYLNRHAEGRQELILDLLHVQGIGPKTVAFLYRELDVKSLDDLSARRARDGCVALKVWARRKKRRS